MNTNNSIIGTIVEAGTDETGQCRLTIHTEPGDLRKLTELPLYRPALITIKAVGMGPESVTIKAREQ